MIPPPEWEEARDSTDRLLTRADMEARDLKNLVRLLGGELNVQLHNFDDGEPPEEKEETARDLASAFRVAAVCAIAIAERLERVAALCKSLPP